MEFNDDEVSARANKKMSGVSGDPSKIPHLKQHTTDEQKKNWAKYVLNQNRGAYSSREYDMYGQIVNDDIKIKNLENRHIKKNEDYGKGQ